MHGHRAVQRCGWAGSAASMWEDDPLVAATHPCATAWPAVFPPEYLAARAAAGDRLAAALEAPIADARRRCDALTNAEVCLCVCSSTSLDPKSVLGMLGCL
jgi:hypothetical protein